MKITTAAAALGAADTATFVWSRRSRLLSKPGRLAGSLVSLAVWGGLTAAAARNDRGQARALAGAAFVANGAMLAAHLKRRVASPRIFLGAGLATAAVVAAARAA